MTDFTPCEINKFKAYGGANGNKIYRKNKHCSHLISFMTSLGIIIVASIYSGMICKIRELKSKMRKQSIT